MENKSMNNSQYTMYPTINKKNHNDTTSSIFRSNANMKDYKGINFFETFGEKYLIKDNKLKFDEYRKTSNDIMKEYHYKTKEESSSFASMTNSKLITDIEMNKLKLSFHHNALNHHSSEESSMKININGEDFKNPIYSLLALQKNKMIYNCMSHNINNREIDKLKEIREILDETKKKSQKLKIKITNTAPKYIESSIPNNHIGTNSLSVDFKNMPSTMNNRSNTKSSNKHIQFNGVINYDKETNSTNMFGYYIYSRKNFPEGREQFSWCIDGSDIVLYGGLTTSHNNFVWMLDPVNIEWKKIESKNTEGNLRYGHSIALHQKKLYIFGGRTKFQHTFYYPDLEVFDLEDKMWNNPILYTSSTMKFRRNHVAVIVGQHMLIHGGISEDEEYLNDTHLLSFNPLKWVRVSIGPDDHPPYLAWHTCSLVLPNDQLYSPKLNIFKLPDQNITRKISGKIKEKGIYFFGGKYNSDGELSNEVWVLRIGRPTFQWIKITTLGENPCPRFAHSMSFYEESNYLIIHGGRNDSLSDGYALNDTFLLDLWTFNWIKVKINFDSPLSKIYKRCSHSSLVYSMNKSLIF